MTRGVDVTRRQAAYLEDFFAAGFFTVVFFVVVAFFAVAFFAATAILLPPPLRYVHYRFYRQATAYACLLPKYSYCQEKDADRLHRDNQVWFYKYEMLCAIPCNHNSIL